MNSQLSLKYKAQAVVDLTCGGAVGLSDLETDWRSATAQYSVGAIAIRATLMHERPGADGLRRYAKVSDRPERTYEEETEEIANSSPSIDEPRSSVICPPGSSVQPIGIPVALEKN